MKMCAKCGGSMKKGGATKKMAKGGVQKIVGMPGYNATLYPTSFKKGGIKKTLIKAQLGIPVPPAEDPKKEYSDARKRAKLEARFDKRDERQEARQTARDLAESKRREENEVKSAKKEIRKGIRREKRLTSNSLFKKGGVIKKMQPGGATGPNPNPTGKKPFEDILGAAAGIAGILGASSYFNSDKAAARQKARLEKRDEKKEARQTARNLAKSKRREEKGFKAISGPSFKNGGATSFGMLSVKAGIDKNPKPTAADRIAGAKMKKKMGGSTKKK